MRNNKPSKKTILLIVFSLIVSFCNAQEWFTSYDVAKRLALIQDKMLFVIWESSFDYQIPLFAKSDDGTVSVIDISQDTSWDPIIQEYFIPVRLPEWQYEDFVIKAKGRGYRYINKLNDDSIKIMDVNGNILNVDQSIETLNNLTFIISKYALNTSYLKAELQTYSEEKNFITTFRLAIKYIDMAIFVDENLKPEIIQLANIYLKESEAFLSEDNSETKEAYAQRIELIRLKELLILDQHRKAHRKIKRFDAEQVNDLNKPLFAFLNYTALMLLDEESNAELWKSEISSLDLKKAELIINNNASGIRN